MSRREWLYLIVSLALLPLMVTSDSLWVDEGGTALYAMQPDFQSWLAHLNQEGGGDAQMPLGAFYAWLGGKILGVSEWQLRAVNILWGALTLVILSRIGRRLQLPWLPLLFALQPFFWFYTNEARPYASQITFGALMLLAVVQFIQARGQGCKWAIAFTVSMVLLCASSMITPAFIGAVVAVVGFIAFKNKWKLERSALFILIFGGVLVLPIGYYYMETLRRGVQGTVIWKVDLRYIAYIGYEITGSLGLGPSVDHLRELALATRGKMPVDLIIRCAWASSLLAVVVAIFLVAIRYGRENFRTYFIPLALIFLLELAFLFTGGFFVHKAFWPRHYSPVFPFYVAALGLALDVLLDTRKMFARVLAIIFGVLLIAAVVGIRFGAEHRKEDYRWAAQQTLQFAQEGMDVWWCGGSEAGNYYGITFNIRPPGRGAIFLMKDRHWDGKLPLPEDTSGAKPPSYILMSRPDISDETGLVQKFIQDEGYQKVESRGTFDVWKK